MEIAPIADALERTGWILLPAPLQLPLLAQLCARCHADAPERFRAARIGRGGERHEDGVIRGDAIAWLDGADDADGAYLAWMEALRLGLNEALCLGLFDFEAHYAIFGAGTGYARHSDVLRGSRRRILSTVLWLNERWQAGDGGELRLFEPDEAQGFETVAPTRGRMILFLSDRFPHEVLRSRVERHSLAGWFRAS